MITIHLDKDEQTNYEVKDIKKVDNLDDLINTCAKKFKVTEDSSMFGLKAKT